MATRPPLIPHLLNYSCMWYAFRLTKFNETVSIPRSNNAGQVQSDCSNQPHCRFLLDWREGLQPSGKGGDVINGGYFMTWRFHPWINSCGMTGARDKMTQELVEMLLLVGVHVEVRHMVRGRV